MSNITFSPQNIQSNAKFQISPFVLKLHQMVPNPEPSITQPFQAYQSTLINPKNPNLHSISSKTSPIVLDRRLKFRTKMPFGQNSSKNQFASSYHVLHTLPIKTHKFRAKNHTKISPKINNSVRPFMRKMH